jgi:hypothetical protein
VAAVHGRQAGRDAPAPVKASTLAVVPSYRLIFPTPRGLPIEETPTARYESKEPCEVGAVIEHGGKRWTVTEAPLEQPEYGSVADLMVWPAD